MARIELITRISAPAERCFDLARSIDLHMRTTAATGERAIAGVTSGLLELGQEVTWRARHFGVWQTLSSRITAFDRPRYFRDSQVRGAFRSFAHDHFFESSAGGTVMRDVLEYTAPFGLLGRLAERMVLTEYLRRFLEERNRQLKHIAESGEWIQFLKARENEST